VRLLKRIVENYRTFEKRRGAILFIALKCVVWRDRPQIVVDLRLGICSLGIERIDIYEKEDGIKAAPARRLHVFESHPL